MPTMAEIRQLPARLDLVRAPGDDFTIHVQIRDNNIPVDLTNVTLEGEQADVTVVDATAGKVEVVPTRTEPGLGSWRLTRTSPDVATLLAGSDRVTPAADRTVTDPSVTLEVGVDQQVTLELVGPPGAAATVAVGDVTVVNPDVNPDVSNVGTAANAVLDFVLPRASDVTVGQVTVQDPDEVPTVADVGVDGDVTLDFGLPRAASVDVSPPDVLNPDEVPTVDDDGVQGDVLLRFGLPRATAVTVGTVTVVNPDQLPAVEDVGTGGDVVLDVDLPRAPDVSVGQVVTGSPGDPAQVTDVGVDGDVVLDFVVPEGVQGDGATVDVGDVTVVNPDVNPDVQNVGTPGDAVFDFDLPRAPQFAVGQVDTGDPGDPATVTDVGTDGDVVLDFVIPEGEKGDQGDPGDVSFAPGVEAGQLAVVDSVDPDVLSGIDSDAYVNPSHKLIPANELAIGQAASREVLAFGGRSLSVLSLPAGLSSILTLTFDPLPHWDAFDVILIWLNRTGATGDVYWRWSGVDNLTDGTVWSTSTFPGNFDAIVPAGAVDSMTYTKVRENVPALSAPASRQLRRRGPQATDTFPDAVKLWAVLLEERVGE